LTHSTALQKSGPRLRRSTSALNHLHVIPRILVPEQLDALAPEDPAALHSRRDLRLINFALGNSFWWRRTFARVGPAATSPSRRGLELGAGDGILARRHGLHALDPVPPPADWPAGQDWHQSDVRNYAGWAEHDLIAANLFLHHLDDEALRDLGRKINPHARVVLACEPLRRAGRPRLLEFFCTVIGANPVTRHDGAVSIRAGFIGNELPDLLGLHAPLWRVKITESHRGAYRMVALRTS